MCFEAELRSTRGELVVECPLEIKEDEDNDGGVSLLQGDDDNDDGPLPLLEGAV